MGDRGATLARAAAAALLLAACKKESPPSAASAEPVKGKAKLALSAVAPPEMSAKAQRDDDCCMGKNSCKGKGGCAVPESHACAGQNECRGKGGCRAHCPR